MSLQHVREGRLHTLLTACFSHRDVPHLLANMFTLYFMWNKYLFPSSRLVRPPMNERMDYIYRAARAVNMRLMHHQEPHRGNQAPYAWRWSRHLCCRPGTPHRMLTRPLLHPSPLPVTGGVSALAGAVPVTGSVSALAGAVPVPGRRRGGQPGLPRGAVPEGPGWGSLTACPACGLRMTVAGRTALQRALLCDA